ncbi:MAG TPA: hypothetical protein ENN21_11365 [Spirochaetes bacterium]|nr:hypothetical protein [Spirochaetota bacterium]
MTCAMPPLKKRFLSVPLAVLVLAFSAAACAKTPGAVPAGSWTYDLLVNGASVGEAVLSNKKEDGRYIMVSELKMGTGDTVNISRQTLTETLDFKPVRLETRNIIITGAKRQEIDTVALFRGREVEITMGGHRTVITLKDDFVLDGNYFLSEFIRNGFREGTEIKGRIYDPSIELETPIAVTARVVGWETVEVAGKKQKLLHIVQSLEQVKSADSYMDEDGVMVKALIQMLNLNIELVRK